MTSSEKASVQNLRSESLPLDDIEPIWSSLVARITHPAFFHRREWHATIRERLVPDVRYIVFFDDREPVALFPFTDIANRRSRMGEVSLPGHTEIFIRDCLIAEPYLGAPWRAILGQHVRRESGSQAKAFRFHRVPARSCAAMAFAAADPGVRRKDSDGHVHCDVTDADALDALSHKHLRNIDRLSRRAGNEMGAVDRLTFEGPEAATDGLDLFARIEERSWKGPEGTATSLSCQPEALAFYRAVLTAFGASGDARVDVLTIGGEPTASQLAIRAAGTWNLLKVGFNDAYAACGPGNILLKSFLEEMAADPDVSDVSLVTNPPWAARWHMVVEPTYDVVVFPPTLAGRLGALGQDTIGAARRLRTIIGTTLGSLPLE